MYIYIILKKWKNGILIGISFNFCLWEKQIEYIKGEERKTKLVKNKYFLILLFNKVSIFIQSSFI